VLLYKDAIPFTKYTGGIGRHAVGKNHNAPGDKVSWPQKATKTFLDLLTNIASNSDVSLMSMNLFDIRIKLRIFFAMETVTTDPESVHH
jgi:ribosomal protein L22